MASGLYSELFTLVISLINRFVSSECSCSANSSFLLLSHVLTAGVENRACIFKLVTKILRSCGTYCCANIRYIQAKAGRTQWKNRGHGQSFRANAGCYPDPSMFISTPPSLFVLLRALKSSQHSLCSLLIVDTPGFQNPRLAQQQRGATFEELCHNYTQERLQTLFHERTFVREMERYKEVPLVPRRPDTHFSTFYQRLGCFLFMQSPHKPFDIFSFDFHLQQKMVGQREHRTSFCGYLGIFQRFLTA